MNLWVKSVRQLAVLAVASFFFSCEDETSLIGFKDPKPKFNVSYIEIPLSSSVVLFDSLISDQKPYLNRRLNSNLNPYSTVWPQSNGVINGSVLVGEYSDPVLGNVRTDAYLQLHPTSVVKLDATSVYDSIAIELRLNYYSYGFSSDQQIKFTVNEITGDTLDRGINVRSFTNSPAQVISAAPLGEAKVNIKYTDFVKQYTTEGGKQDTLLARTRLSDEFGMRVFNLAMNFGADADKVFTKEIKGLSLQPVGTNGIIGIGSMTALTRVYLYYHYTKDGASTKATRAFSFGGPTIFNPNYTRINTDRGASELGAAQKYQSFQTPSGLRLIQSGDGAITKLDLTKFYEFADTVKNMVINTAELIISGVEEPAGLNPHASLTLKVMSGDRFSNEIIDSDSVAIYPYYRSQRVINDLKHYYVYSDDGSGVAALNYDTEKNQYSSFMTFFYQLLYGYRFKDGDINPDRIKYLALYPRSPSPFVSVNRTVFNASNVKLRIYYTKPADAKP